MTHVIIRINNFRLAESKFLKFYYVDLVESVHRVILLTSPTCRPGPVGRCLGISGDVTSPTSYLAVRAITSLGVP